VFAVIALLVSAFAQQPDTAVIEGVVRASGTDAPIAGADVNAFPATSGERVQAVTDTGGRFRLLVRPDRYQVTVTKEGFSSPAYRPMEPAPPTTTTAFAGQRASVAFQLVPTSTITGRVFDPEGHLIEGASVMLSRLTWTGDGQRLEIEDSSPEVRQAVEAGQLHVNLRPNPSLAFLSGSAVAGKDGAFVLNDDGVVHYRVELFGLPADAYIAAARLGGADILENGFSLHGDSTGLMEIAVSGLGGRIVGVVRNPQNEIVPSGRVVLVPEPDLRSRRDLFKVATLDQYGRFNIQGIRPGRYKLFAWDDVPFGAYFDSEFLRSYEDQAKAVTVKRMITFRPRSRSVYVP